MADQVNYKVYKLNVGTETVKLVLTDHKGVLRSCDFIQVIVSSISEPEGIVQMVLFTPDDRENTFDEENKIIELEEGESFSDNIAVEMLWIRTTKGTATVKIYTSW